MVKDSSLPADEQLSILLKKTRQPAWKRILTGLGQGIGFSIIILSMAWGLSVATGNQSVAERTDRNAALDAAGTNGIRCFLETLNETPEIPVTDQEIDNCFTEYDKLTNFPGRGNNES